MFHKAIELRFLEGTALEVMFQTGEIKRYDMRVLFPKYPQLQLLPVTGFTAMQSEPQASLS